MFYFDKQKFLSISAVMVCCGMGPAGFGAPPPGAIGFGSCIKQERPQPVWEAVRAADPDVFVLLGDTIYGDSEDMGVLRAKYAQLAANPGFAALRRSAEVVGTWDDHDYGRNDAGVEFPAKRAAQQEFWDFFGEPAESPQRAQEGVYRTTTFGGEGAPLVQVILLDTRYFRDPLTKVPDGERRANRGPYGPGSDPSATVLGAAQWAWLEAELRKPADLRVVGTSIQAIPSEHGHEKWENFPSERARLFSLIRETGAGGVVLISGDRHLGEISCLPADDPLGVGYPLYEITSSSLNAPFGGNEDEPNRYRVSTDGPVVDVNFGLLSIDWQEAGPQLTMELRGEAGDVLARAEVALSELGG